MEKKVIRKNHLSNMGVTADGKRRVQLFADAYKLCSEYIEVKDRIEFEKDFRSYLLKELKAKGKGIVDHMPPHKLTEFYLFPMHVLDEIQNRYKQLSHIQLNADFTEAILPDENEYAETPEQIERLQHLEQLIDALNKIQGNRWNIDWWAVARATNGAIIAKSNKHGLPSESYVKPRRF